MGKKSAKIEWERARIGFDRERKAPLSSHGIDEMRVLSSDLNVFPVNEEVR